MKISVVANCQAAPIASLLNLAFDEVEILPVPAVHTIPQDKPEIVLDIVRHSDVIVHQPIGERFGPISSDELRAQFPDKTFMSFPSIYFGGISPQLCYLRHPKTGTIQTPLTEYHDTRIVDCFLRGLSERQCLAEIEAGTEDAVSHFAKAWKTSVEHDAGVDIPVMEIVELELQNNACFHTFNHPSNAVLGYVARNVAKLIGLNKRSDIKLPQKQYLGHCKAAVPSSIPESLNMPWRRSDYEVRGAHIRYETLIREFYALYRGIENFSEICRANAYRFNMPVSIPAIGKEPSAVPKTQIISPAKKHSQPGLNSRNKKMHVSSLISDWRVSCFSEVLPFYTRLEPGLKVCVDGGAGLGETAKKIFNGLSGHQASIVAFEPNPANVSKFLYKNDDVHLVEAALSCEKGTAQFLVTATTHETKKDSFLEKDTSFVGKLATDGDKVTTGDRYDVEVVRLDDSLKELGYSGADFIKLDLQGGELPALQGLGDMIESVHWMWIEYGGQEGLIDFLLDKGFVLFDTEYLFVGRPNELIEELFDITNIGHNSINKQIFFGHRKHIWRDYEVAFSFAQRHRRMVQTDLIAVAPEKVASFLTAAQSASEAMDDGERYIIPRQLF